MSSNAKAVGFFVLCFTFGLSVFFSFHDETLIQRDPAAVGNKVFQISSLSSEQIRNQLSQKIKVFPTVDGRKSIQFSGFSSGLCKTYPEIEMEFQAEGIAVGGEAPMLKISAPCESGQDPSEMASIQLPIEKLLAEKPRNAEFKFDGYTAKIEFKNASDEWPKQWILKNVYFKDLAGNQKSAHFDRKITSDKSSRPIVLEF